MFRLRCKQLSYFILQFCIIFVIQTTCCPISKEIELKIPEPLYKGSTTVETQTTVDWNTSRCCFTVTAFTDGRNPASLHPEVKRLVIVVHGSSLNPSSYYCRVADGGEIEGFNVTREAFIIAPLFAEGPTNNLLNVWWNSNWRRGSLSSVDGPTLDGARLSSFSVLDWLVSLAEDRNLYPNLERIVITGHSAGGQVTQRYAVSSWLEQNHQQLRIPIIYIPSNPSAFAYVISERPSNIPSFPPHIPSDLFNFNFSLPLNNNSCDGGYDNWGFGLKELGNYMYPNEVGAERMRNSYLSGRRVIYLQSLEDTCNEVVNCCPENCSDSGLSTACGSMSQGPIRLTRGLAFYDSLKRATEIFPGKGFSFDSHILIGVPGEGHSSTGVYKRSYKGRTAVWGIKNGSKCETTFQCYPGFYCFDTNGSKICSEVSYSNSYPSFQNIPLIFLYINILLGYMLWI